MPIGVAVSGANRHDQKLLFETLDSLPVERPKATRRRRQHLCGDLGYDCAALRRRLRRRGYLPHIKSRGEQRQAKRQHGKRARRWVVERVASWLNRYRRILVRWEKKVVNYLGLLHLVFAHILWRNC
jgi:putative transposase